MNHEISASDPQASDSVTPDSTPDSDPVRSPEPSDWQPAPPPLHKEAFGFWLLVLLMIAGLKLALVAHLPLRAVFADRDNLRYVLLAENFLQGDTTYDAFALLRQPIYPVFLALGHGLQLPTRLWQEIGYLFGGLGMMGAIARFYHRPRLATFGFVLYAFAPFSFHWNRQTLQEVVYLPLMALLVGAVIGTIEARQWRFYLWSGLLGTVFALLWNTRPEGVLLLPVLGLTFGIIAWRRDRSYQTQMQQQEQQQRAAAYAAQQQQAQVTEQALNDWLEAQVEAQLEAQVLGIPLEVAAIDPLRQPSEDDPDRSIAQIPHQADHQADLNQANGDASTDLGAGLPSGKTTARTKPRSQPPSKPKLIARLRQLKPVAIGILLAMLPVLLLTLGIAVSNAARFGLLATSDFKTPEFAAAYAQLTRVQGEPRSARSAQAPQSNPASRSTSTPANQANQPSKSQPLNSEPSTFTPTSRANAKPVSAKPNFPIPVSASARSAIYAVSPKFAELKPHLEVGATEGWRGLSCAEGICQDYAGGFFFWALRDAVAAEGYYRSPATAAQFYRQLATEIEQACDRGQLTCRRRGWGLLPTWQWRILPHWLGSVQHLTERLGNTALTLKLADDPGSPAVRQQYAWLTREPVEFGTELATQRSQPLDNYKNQTIEVLAGVYRLMLSPIVLGLSLMGLTWQIGSTLGRTIRRVHTGRSRSPVKSFGQFGDLERSGQFGQFGQSGTRGKKSAQFAPSSDIPPDAAPPLPLCLLVIALVTIGLRLFTIAYIDVTSWPVGGGDRYLRPLLPFVWLILLAGVSYGTDQWQRMVRRKFFQD